MITRPSDIPHTQSTAEWSLGAVLAQREIDERTVVVVIRADVGLGPSLTFERRLLGLRLAGFTTIVVDVGEAERVVDVMVATLMRCRRKLAAREGRLVIAAENRDVRRSLKRAGLELADRLRRPMSALREEGRCTARVSGFPRSASAVSTVPARGLRA